MPTIVKESRGAIGDLADQFSRLPGIGPKSAERITHFLLSGDRSIAKELAGALQAIVDQIRPCPECFNLTEGDLCKICSDGRRDPSAVCVVESPRDVALMERAATYRGRYHVLGGRLAPLDNMGPDRLTVGALVDRVKKGGIREVILATSPTLEGDGTALFVSSLLHDTGVTITRIARGIPSGSSLELANSQMITDALDGRRSF